MITTLCWLPTGERARCGRPGSRAGAMIMSRHYAGYPSPMPDPPAVDETIPGTAIGACAATVAALREALAAGTLTARGLTAFYLSRIERLDPLLHAVISVIGDALAEAQASDEALASGAPARPLEG